MDLNVSERMCTDPNRSEQVQEVKITSNKLRKKTEKLHEGFWKIHRSLGVRCVRVTSPPLPLPAQAENPWSCGYPPSPYPPPPAQAEKIAKNFKRPKNCEDSSDLDDFMLETIAAMRSIISRKNWGPRHPKISRKLQKLVRKRRRCRRRGRWHGGAVKLVLLGSLRGR